MKKILTLIAIVGLGAFASYGQGTITIYNTGAGQAWSTNGASQGLGTGVTAGTGQYIYTLLVAGSAPGTAPSSNPLNSAWTQATYSSVGTIGAGVYATNYLSSGGIRAATASSTTGFGVNQLPLGNGTYAASQATYYMLVGWSVNLGYSWSTVASDLAENWANLSAGQVAYFGTSGVAYQVAGSPGVLNAVDLMNNPTGVSGAGITTASTLYAVVSPAPEPGTMALAALGGASLLLFRRRK